ncbi:hypothetical protein ECDEC9A_3009 [Escherichia coli DEC9A]|nr:hypothetical protein ECDEC9A_3009 [Escherichia coli DEC9A]
MALIKCPECQKEVSDSALCCPACGKQLKNLSVHFLENSLNGLLYFLIFL